MNRKIFLPLALAAAVAGQQTAQHVAPQAIDKYKWLEDVSGEKAMAWVRAHNEASAKVLESDPHFADLEAAALKVLESPERLPVPRINGNEIYNTWQDASHIRGILRRTSVEDYLTAQPHWQTILDYDALARQDNEKWVQHGLNCWYPGNQQCLVGLSAGGEDAETLREYDLKAGKFVEGGFVLPKSKQDVAWVDKDTLLVARDWGPGTMTTSGYPFVVKMWKRGQPLDQAKEVYRGQPSDTSAGAVRMDDASGHHFTILYRHVNFFESEYSLLTEQGPKRLALPRKSEVNEVIAGRLIVTLNEDWTPAGWADRMRQGSVVAMDVDDTEMDPTHLKPHVVFAPTATEFVQDVRSTKRRLLITTLENVQGRLYSYAPGPFETWSRKRLDVPDNRTVTVTSANWADDRFFASVTGFLTPSSLWLGDAMTAKLTQSKTLPAQFDASADTVEQLSAVSKDGTKVPYFVVHRKDMKYDGSNPTLMTAYGGFQISMTPRYDPTVGKLWLERGGVFVLANIRGGGEFGPAWHEAGLKTHRQRIYDDFAAVGQDLVTRKITSPRRLGIEGGSNGGLLMGVEMTQHPEMWNAVVIQIPLLDMLGFEHIAAGASWVGEYGSVSIPAQRTFLASISPYNQLKRGVKYPEPLIWTTTRDDRVGPQHARKFAAKMEEYGLPFYFDEIVEGGHGSGADLKEKAKTEAVEYTYLTRKLM
jgi:prolyl oligopeptidase